MEGSLNLGDYEEVSPTAIAASKIVSDFWITLGRPKNPFTVSGAKLMDLIISVWEDCYPIDAKLWLDERKQYKAAEKRISEQVAKHTGRSLASYPYPIFQLMKVCFKGFNPAERKNCLRMVKKWPLFLMANRA